MLCGKPLHPYKVSPKVMTKYQNEIRADDRRKIH